jgi:hypothetical protein
VASTRRAVLGKGAAVAAAGAGGTVLATGGIERRRLDLRVEQLHSDGGITHERDVGASGA